MKKKIFDLIKNSKSIVLLTHESPDGDAIGSVMSFYYMLKNFKKDVDIVIPVVPELFLFFKDIDKVINKLDKNYDLAIVLDCATEKRIAQDVDFFNNAKVTISIDHHISNALFADYNLVEGDTPACCQVIYNLFKEWNIYIDNNIGEALMTGLLTDTGGFKNNNVNADTFVMAADLYDFGVDIHNLYKNVLTMKNKAQFELMRIVMDRLEFFENGKIAFAYIDSNDLKNVHAKLGDHEGLVDIGRNIVGVEVSIFLREEDGEYKISLRSNGLVNVNNIASIFDGGGHTMAAGAKSKLSFKETKKKIIDATKKELNI